jgi:ABC-type multidrug transport system fused ATPase/permease subunit
MLYILQKHYLATSAQLRKLQVAAQAPIFSTVGAAVEGRVTLRAMQKQSYMADTLSERVYTGLRPGYLFSSIQRWMLLVLNLANASVLTVLAALLVGLRGRGNIGWAGLALLNAVTLSQDTMLLMIWWTSFENHMASMERILEYTTTPMERVEASELRLEETWPWAGRVKLENLSLSYEYDISLYIKFSNILLTPQ